MDLLDAFVRILRIVVFILLSIILIGILILEKTDVENDPETFLIVQSLLLLLILLETMLFILKSSHTLQIAPNNTQYPSRNQFTITDGSTVFFEDTTIEIRVYHYRRMVPAKKIWAAINISFLLGLLPGLFKFGFSPYHNGFVMGIPFLIVMSLGINLISLLLYFVEIQGKKHKSPEYMDTSEISNLQMKIEKVSDKILITGPSRTPDEKTMKDLKIEIEKSVLHDIKLGRLNELVSYNQEKPSMINRILILLTHHIQQLHYLFIVYTDKTARIPKDSEIQLDIKRHTVFAMFNGKNQAEMTELRSRIINWL